MSYVPIILGVALTLLTLAALGVRIGLHFGWLAG